MNYIPNRFPATTIVFMLFLAAFLFCIAPKNISAQTSSLPTFTISSEGAENGAEQQGTKNILLRERRLTLMTYDMQPQRGYVVIRRVSGSSATVTLRLGISYQDAGNRFLADNGTQRVTLPFLLTPYNFSIPAPPGVTTSTVSINGLQDDLQPFLFANNLSTPVATIGTTSQGVNELVFNPQVQAAIIRFTARWSDQVYLRNPNLQGQRTVVVSLLPGDGYEIPSGFNALTRITLDDPANVPPMLLPAGRQFCGQVNLTSTGNIPAENRIEIESPFLDAAGMPTAMFYDDNYDPMSYSVNTSFPATVLSLRIENSDARFQGRPSLYFALNPTVRSTSGSITLFARDSRGGFAESTCPSVMLTTNVHEQRVVTALSAAPNPASAETQLSYTLQEPSAVQIEVYSTLGERLITIDEGIKPRGEYTTTLDVGRLATGVYPVRVRAGRVMRSVMMQVLR